MLRRIAVHTGEVAIQAHINGGTNEIGRSLHQMLRGPINRSGMSVIAKFSRHATRLKLFIKVLSTLSDVVDIRHLGNEIRRAQQGAQATLPVVETKSKKYGVEVHQDVMAVGQEMRTGYTYGIPHEYHDISEPLSRKTVLLRNACVLETASPEKEGFDAKAILEGTDGSWGEKDPTGRLRYDKDVDIAGPTTLGVAVGPAKSDPSTPLGPTGRAHVVAFADADFLSDRLMADSGVAMAANTDLFLNSVNWMVGKTENIGIQPRERERRAVHMTPVRRRRLFWGAVILPALAMVILGIVVWRLRSR